MGNLRLSIVENLNIDIAEIEIYFKNIDILQQPSYTYTHAILKLLSIEFCTSILKHST